MPVGFPSSDFNPPERRTTREEATNHIRNAEENQQQVVAVNAVNAVNTINTDAIPVEIYSDVFEFSRLIDLNSIMQVSEHLEAATSNYLQNTLKSKKISVKMSRRNIDIFPQSLQQMPYLTKYVPDVTIYGTDSRLLQHVEQFKNVQKMTFKKLLPSGHSREMIISNAMIEILKNLKAIKFCAYQFNDRTYNRLLLHCRENIKCLTIETNPPTTNRSTHPNWWYFLAYPNLETIHWDQGYIHHQNALRTLLDQNPRIVNHRITHNMRSAMNFIRDNNLRLQKLSLTFRSSDARHFASIVDEINFLHENGHYQQLYLNFTSGWNFDEHVNLIGSLRSLYSVSYDGEYTSAMSQLAHLKELRIQSIQQQGATEAAVHIQQLERLFIKEVTFDAVWPFIRFSPNLTDIIVDKVARAMLNVQVDTFIRSREDLPNAKIQTLFLDERLYMILKKYNHQPQILKIRRLESFQSDF